MQDLKPTSWYQRGSKLWQWLLANSKWPTAIVFALWTPLLAWAWYMLLLRIIDKPSSMILFLIGVGLFIFAWKSLLRHSKTWQLMMKWEHLATHWLFAFLTGQVSRLHQSSDSDASDLNAHEKSLLWLTESSPYFFPLSAIVLWFVAILIPLGFIGWTSLALGFASAFHLVSTYRELRFDRTELTALDWRFCWLFLPAANLLFTGFLIAFAQNGFEGIITFIKHAVFVGG